LIQFVADEQAYPAIIDNQSQLQNILQEALSDLLQLIRVQSIFDKFEIKKGTIKKNSINHFGKPILYVKTL